ncbi:MAG: MBL fold metallo-hydrolase [Clostridia bacterium]|nr:MBL fold metallo-hydrolase [Clostridia bacterium]
MKIKFLGTGAAEGVPSMFCNCEYCNNIRALGSSEYRSRTQVLIDGILGVDFPPEAYSNSLKHGYKLTNLKYLLVTHSHMDHFYAHDFILRGYKYAKDMAQPVLHIYGNSEVKAVFDECTAREMKPDIAPHISFNVIKPYDRFTAGEYKVIAIPAQHSKTEDALLFYIGNGGKGYLHLHDSGRISDEALEYLAKCGVKAQAVAFDCTFVDYTAGEVSRHMGIEDDMVMKDKLHRLGVIDENTKLIITHFSHNSNPTRANLKRIEEKYGVTAAYDGMEIEI